MIRNLRQDMEAARFKPWEMPVNQMDGPHLVLLELVTLTPFNSVKDYDDYLSRLHQVPGMLEQVTANMRQGMKDGLMPPRYLLEKVVPQTQEIANTEADSSPFAKPVKNFLPAFPRLIRSGCARRCWPRSTARFFRPTNASPPLCVTTTRLMAAPSREYGRCPMARNAIAFKFDA